MRPFCSKFFWLTLGAAILLAAPAFAQNKAAINDYDNKSAVIFTYFAIGNDENPSASITEEQFAAQIEEIKTGGYTVRPLLEITAAFATGKTLPDRTIALTFDGADKSILDKALPLLQQNNIAFTVFVPADRISSEKPPFMSWNDLRRLKKTGLVTFGLHPSSYTRLVDTAPDDMKRQINNSIAAMRKELDINPTLLAYPFGEYDSEAKAIVKSMGFAAAFGQQSGVAYAGDDRFSLPRFTLTERYGDIERFVMTANALPLPVTDLAPSSPRLNTLDPAIGFTVPDSLKKSLKNLSCFSSSDEKPKLEILNNRVEIRMSKPLSEDRPRINCTLPVASSAGEEPRWRWFGMLYTIPSELLEKAEPVKSAKSATAYPSDDISIE